MAKSRIIDCFEHTNIIGKAVLKCTISDCERYYTDKSSAIRHVKAKHRDVHDAIIKAKSLSEKTSALNLELRVNVNICEIRDSCVELVAINAMPLYVLESRAFKKLLEPYQSALSNINERMCISTKSIKRLIGVRVEQMKQIIHSETRNIVVCLMLDIASRYNRSVLGISVSYLHDNELKVRTIAMHALRVTHTAQNIAAIVKDNLAAYQISLDQILSITTDNGRNVLKCVAMLDAEYQRSMLDDAVECDEEGSDADDNTLEHDAAMNEHYQSESDDSLICDSEYFNESYYSDLLHVVRSEFPDIIHGISCACHCLHLVVVHAVDKSTNVRAILDRCRELAKKLRSPTYRAMLSERNSPQAILDVVTRWNSSYSMVGSHQISSNVLELLYI